METFLGLAFFILGSIIGSFLNVVILRFRSGRGLSGRSLCFSCSRTLAWTELVPIASFLTQGGKCTGCRTRISLQYPLVEALTGFVFLFLFFRFEYLFLSVPLLFAILFAYYGFVACLLIVLSVYDLKHKILPDSLSLLFGITAFVGMFFISGDAIVAHLPSGLDMAAGLLCAAPFALLWLVSNGRWMGLGDAKLMIGIGFLLGLSAGAAAILISFWIGAVVSVVILLCTSFSKSVKLSMKTAIPFGPFLALGTMVTLLARINFDSLLGMFVR